MVASMVGTLTHFMGLLKIVPASENLNGQIKSSNAVISVFLNTRCPLKPIRFQLGIVIDSVHGKPAEPPLLSSKAVALRSAIRNV